MSRIKKLLGILGVISLLGLVALGCNPSGTLNVEITVPEDGATIAESPVTVTGNVSGAAAVVTVNGIAAVVGEDGSFSAEVELTEGDNTITAVATLDGLEAEDSITVTYAPEAIPTGSVEVHVTDPGADTVVTSVNITASAIEIHEAADGEEGEWIPLDITLPTFDLIELKEGGLEEILASGNVTAGKYTQIRMTIEKVEVSIGENEPQEATVPSGELKFVQPFEVSEGETIILTLDFDAEKSVNITGAEEIIFKPTVKLTITPAPVLSLEITSPEDGAELTESPVTITGNVSDATATITVNGIAAEVAEDGTFSAEVELTEGENVIEAVAVLDEQEVSDSVIVTYTSSIAGTGTVRYIDLEGGFYGIVSDDGQKYDPINLASDFQQDGLKIRFEAMTRSDLASIHMWGIPIEITNIEKLESELLSVEITSPGDGTDLTESPATVTGNISDPAATVMVNGIAAEVAEDGTFSAEVELTEGENVIEAVAVLDEQEISDSITVTYTPAA